MTTAINIKIKTVRKRTIFALKSGIQKIKQNKNTKNGLLLLLVIINQNINDYNHSIIIQTPKEIKESNYICSKKFQLESILGKYIEKIWKKDLEKI